MPLVAALKRDPLITPHLKTACAERGMAASISPTIATDDIVIISPDSYYNSAIGHRDHAEADGNPPKSPDCLVVVRCADGTFSIFVVELRNIVNQRGFTVEEIRTKFNTCLHDFMEGVLGRHFNNADYQLNKVRLLFVSDPYGDREPQNQRAQLSRGPKMDLLLTLPPFRFDNRRLGIEHHPTAPLIRPC